MVPERRKEVGPVIIFALGCGSQLSRGMHSLEMNPSFYPDSSLTEESEGGGGFGETAADVHLFILAHPASRPKLKLPACPNQTNNHDRTISRKRHTQAFETSVNITKLLARHLGSNRNKTSNQHSFRYITRSYVPCSPTDQDSSSLLSAKGAPAVMMHAAHRLMFSEVWANEPCYNDPVVGQLGGGLSDPSATAGPMHALRAQTAAAAGWSPMPPRPGQHQPYPQPQGPQHPHHQHHLSPADADKRRSNESLSSEQTLFSDGLSGPVSIVPYDGSSGQAIGMTSADSLLPHRRPPAGDAAAHAPGTGTGPNSAADAAMASSGGSHTAAAAAALGRAAPAGTQHRGGGNGHGARPSGYRRMWAAVCAPKSDRDGGGGGGNGGSGGAAFREVSVEDLIRAVQALPPAAPAADAVRGGLLYLDSRAFAAVLKGLAKAGLAHRAAELFDEIRWAAGWGVN